MELNTHTTGDIVTLVLQGRFDAHTAPAVNYWMEKAAGTPPAQVIVDLKAVTFIDTTGCAVLVRGMKRCRERNGDVYLCALQQPVGIIFEMTRLDKAFDIFADEAAALAAFAEA